jgi:hypothetical protein
MSEESITKDLESMKAQGITQATILNAGMFALEGREDEYVYFNSDRWYEMFRWSLREAKRLGIHIGVHNCDGWSASGGPWITPEMSMKKFVFTKTAARGGRTRHILPEPLCDIDFYKDIAVIACRTAKPQPTAQDLSGLTVVVNDTVDGKALIDGSPESMTGILQNTAVKFEYDRAVTKSTISILLNFKGAFYFPGHKKVGYSLSASDDGLHYRKVADFDTEKFYSVQFISFPATTARYFRLEVSRIYNLRPWHQAAFAEVQLLGDGEKPVYNPTIPHYLEKVASGRILDPPIIYETNTLLPPDELLQQNSFVNLTDRMNSDGTLDWEAPAGDWIIFRVGYTSTGARNGPATPEGTGLECDKLDTAAVNLHFRNFPLRLIENAGDYTGNTFKFILLDSWEKGYHTWTQAFPDEFRKRRGYDILDWLPALCGETVESVDATEGFLYDFRRTIAEMMEENYYRHFRDLCHHYKLEIHGEVAYGNTGPFPPLDVMRTNSYMDMPMSEFWAIPDSNNMLDYKPDSEDWRSFAAFTHNFYKGTVCGAEAYTGYAHYSETPANLKLFGDKAFCAGINQMVLHSYVYQPFDSVPGMTLGGHGSLFNRSNPFWNYARGWLDYQSRTQYLLQKGEIASDILFFIGDQLPQFFANKTIDNMPSGINAIPCNADILSGLSVTSEGRLKYPGKQEYAILVLPDKPLFSYATLLQIERLFKAGATIYGSKPERMISLADMKLNKDKYEHLINELWSGYESSGVTRNQHDKGQIIWEEPFDSLLAEKKIVPVFNADTSGLMYIHKRTADKELFYVVNQRKTPLEWNCVFHVNGKVPEIWNPQTGEIRKDVFYEINDEFVHIPVKFGAAESLFFVFSEGKSPDRNFHKKPFVSAVIPDKELEINDFTGKIVFKPLNVQTPTDSVEISGFGSFTEFDSPAIRYFSGYATYHINFEVSDTEFLQSAQPIYIHIGRIDAVGEATLNGVRLGNVWMPDTYIPVTGLLKEKNSLEITVATTCRNRIIGDLREYGRLHSVWSYISNDRLTAASHLCPSGVIGPIRIVK